MIELERASITPLGSDCLKIEISPCDDIIVTPTKHMIRLVSVDFGSFCLRMGTASMAKMSGHIWLMG